MAAPAGVRLAPLVVVSGPSGVGKTTLVDRVLAGNRLPLRRAVTATTRDPRPGEVPEVHYHFWTRDRFKEAIARGEMLEYAEVHGRDYYDPSDRGAERVMATRLALLRGALRGQRGPKVDEREQHS